MITRAVPKPRTQSFEGSLEFKWLNIDYDFQTLIDIGCNNGEFGSFLRGYLDIAHVLAFEPLERHGAHLESMGFDLFPVALGDRNGSTSFTVNKHDASSSILPMSDLMRSQFPELQETTPIEVEIRKLDDVLRDRDIGDDVLIKIDAQGVEDAIIRGGYETFSRAKAVIIEMSFVPMYEDQALFNEVHSLLADCGHKFSGIKNQICSVRERRPLFAHCVYQR
ncbi:MAG TPA: FkbM family methyltransferase [Acidiferrobacteraceae bacterium]|nr:FkbM family methyltransferase [Acidiferrobacteraceae bacterium]